MKFPFPKFRRITRGSDFSRAFAAGHCVADGTLVINGYLRYRPPNIPPTSGSIDPAIAPLDTRLGLSIGKVVGNSPIRNHWKRLIREAFRQNYSELPAGLDLVVRPKKGATPNFQAIVYSLQKLANRLDRKLKG